MGNEETLDTWKPARKARQPAALSVLLRTVVCAWCGDLVKIFLSQGGQSVKPVRRVTLRCDGPDGHHDIYVEQYGCSPACEALIRKARPIVALEREEETIIILKTSLETEAQNHGENTVNLR